MVRAGAIVFATAPVASTPLAPQGAFYQIGQYSRTFQLRQVRGALNGVEISTFQAVGKSAAAIDDERNAQVAARGHDWTAYFAQPPPRVHAAAAGFLWNCVVQDGGIHPPERATRGFRDPPFGLCQSRSTTCENVVGDAGVSPKPLRS